MIDAPPNLKDLYFFSFFPRGDSIVPSMLDAFPDLRKKEQVIQCFKNISHKNPFLPLPNIIPEKVAICQHRGMMPPRSNFFVTDFYHFSSRKSLLIYSPFRRGFGEKSGLAIAKKNLRRNGAGMGMGVGKRKEVKLHCMLFLVGHGCVTVRIRTFAATAVGGVRLYNASRVRWGEGEKVCWCRDKIRHTYLCILNF